MEQILKQSPDKKKESEEEYNRKFFGHLKNSNELEPALDKEEIEEQSFLTIGQDYFSYALFAFYIFDEDEKMMEQVEIRKTLAQNKNQEGDATMKQFEGVGDIDFNYMKYARKMRNLNIFYKCMFFFIVEMAMILFVILYYLKWGVDFDTDMGTVTLKYCCIISLHLMQYPVIKQSMNRINYILKHPDYFESRYIPLLICWMKLIVEFGIEVTLLVSTAYENWNVFMIMDFSALIVINYVDLYYCMTIKDDLTERIKVEKYQMEVWNKEVVVKQLNPWEKVSYYLIRLIRQFFDIIYYHFLPYIGMYYSFYMIKQIKNHQIKLKKL